jgi:hypothetical protein
MFLAVALNGMFAAFIKLKAKPAFMVPTDIVGNTVQ